MNRLEISILTVDSNCWSDPCDKKKNPLTSFYRLQKLLFLIWKLTESSLLGLVPPRYREIKVKEGSSHCIWNVKTFNQERQRDGTIAHVFRLLSRLLTVIQQRLFSEGFFYFLVRFQILELFKLFFPSVPCVLFHRFLVLSCCLVGCTAHCHSQWRLSPQSCTYRSPAFVNLSSPAYTGSTSTVQCKYIWMHSQNCGSYCLCLLQDFIEFLHKKRHNQWAELSLIFQATLQATLINTILFVIYLNRWVFGHNFRMQSLEQFLFF